MRVRVCVCVRACVRACVRVCVRACVRVRACGRNEPEVYIMLAYPHFSSFRTMPVRYTHARNLKPLF